MRDLPLPLTWSSTIVRAVYGDSIHHKQKLNASSLKTAALRILSLAFAWIMLMAGISLVGPARESLSLDPTLLDRSKVPYLIASSSLVTVSLNWFLPKTQTVTQTLQFGAWMALFFGVLLLSCQSNRFTVLNTTTIKSMSVGLFFVATSAFSIFPVSCLYSELPETLLVIGKECGVLNNNVLLGRQSFTFFGLCLTVGSMLGSFSVQFLAQYLGTYSLIFGAAISFQIARWLYSNSVGTTRKTLRRKKSEIVPKTSKDQDSNPDSDKNQDINPDESKSISLIDIFRNFKLARGMFLYTAAYSMGVIIIYMERTNILKALGTDKRTGVLGMTGSISSVVTCVLQLLLLWNGSSKASSIQSVNSIQPGQPATSKTSNPFTKYATVLRLSMLPSMFGASIVALTWLPSIWAVVCSVVGVRVVSFVIVRPQREVCWQALPKMERLKAKMMADSVGRKFGDLIAPLYAMVCGSMNGSVVSGLLVIGWLGVSQSTVNAFVEQKEDNTRRNRKTK